MRVLLFIAFGKVFFFHTDEFMRLVDNCQIDLDNWKVQKNIINNQDDYSELEVGFAAFFLNRCNRSGLLSAGPIGGMRQNGNYKIDCRFNKKKSQGTYS